MRRNKRLEKKKKKGKTFNMLHGTEETGMEIKGYGGIRLSVAKGADVSSKKEKKCCGG